MIIALVVVLAMAGCVGLAVMAIATTHDELDFGTLVAILGLGGALIAFMAMAI